MDTNWVASRSNVHIHWSLSIFYHLDYLNSAQQEQFERLSISHLWI